MEFQYSNRVRGMRPSIIRELLKQMSDPDLISFAGGNPDAEAFPAAEIAAISHRLLSQEPAATLQYSITEGLPTLRQAGAAYVNRAGRVKREEDDLIVCSGSQQIMDYMAKLLCNEGDRVAVEDPTFLGALGSFRGYGAVPVGVPLEADGVNLAGLEMVLSASPKPKFYYTIPNYQNPTGVVTSAEKRRAVYELCLAHGVPILEDNPYGELCISGPAPAPIKALDEAGIVVYAASLSKILAPGMRVALCVGPAALLHRMAIAKQGNDVHSSLWAQRVCEQFLTTCNIDAHLARLRGIYRAKANRMAEALRRELGELASFQPPQGGMFLWLSLPGRVPMPDFVRHCLAQKLAVVPGNAFFVDDEAPCQSVRLNFSTPTPQQIDRGVGIMAAVLRGMGQ